MFSPWPQLERKIAIYFKDVVRIIPALVHGDLRSGNYGYCADGPGEQREYISLLSFKYMILYQYINLILSTLRRLIIFIVSVIKKGIKISYL